jgi:cation transport ATPase
MDLSSFFGVLSALTLLLAYWFYIKQTQKGQSTPNPSSWGIWLLVGMINCITYFYIVSSIWESFLAFAYTFCVAIVFIYALKKGKFSKITNLEIIIFILTLIIIIFWRVTANNSIANLLLQVIYVLAYIPTIGGLLKGYSKEYPLSWTTSVIAYGFSIISIALNFNGNWVSIVFPLINGVLGNGLVVVLIYHNKFKLQK